MTKKNGERANWSGQMAFVLAAAASAVGLGNLWRFPASAATYGGGIFILVYIALFFVFGVFLMITEIAVGRATRLSAVSAFASLNRKWAAVGWLGTLVPALILPYYCVIGGWVLRYLWGYLVHPGGMAEKEFFAAFTACPAETLGCTAVFATATFAMIYLGVKKGIEGSNKVLMPLLLALTVGVAAFTVTRPDAAAGLKYYLVPDFARLCNPDGSFSPALLAKTILAAMGQMFFSLSLAMGILVTYGSYMPKSADIGRSSLRIGVIDTFVAVLAGAIIIPPAFAFGGEELARTAGVGLMFVSLPQVFAALPGGSVVAVAFFALALFAALTSAISIAETVVASLCDLFRFHRRGATTLTAVYVALAAVPSALSLTFLDRTDFITNSIFMPVCALLTCIFIGWVGRPGFVRDEVTALGVAFGSYPVYRFIIRYLAPVLIATILVTYVLARFGFIQF